MRLKIFNLLIIGVTLFSLVFPTAQVVQAAPDILARQLEQPTNALPGVDSALMTELSASLLPTWLPDLTANDSNLDDNLLPGWMQPTNQQAGALEQKGLLSPGPGVCPPATSIAMQVIPPFEAVSRGNTSGDTYTVTIKNNSSIAIPEIGLLVDPNLGFYYLGGTASATSSVSGTLVLIDPGTTAPDAAFILIVNALPRPPEKQLLPGETIVFTFRLATNADAKSAQMLRADLMSGDPSPISCQFAVANIRTARGNLTVEKSPTTQDGKFGDVVSWKVTLKNTGLGDVYNAIFSDTPGVGYTGLSIYPTPDFINLAPDASQTYTVAARINSCTNLTNTVAAWWSIGNVDATATVTNPLTDDADILFLLDEPDILVQVGQIPTQTYCGALSATIPVTVTNRGSVAREVNLSANVQGLTINTTDPDWNQIGNTFIYSGGAPTGTLLAGQTTTFTLDISSVRLCSSTIASVQFTPHYKDACLLLDYIGGVNGSSQLLAPEAPTLSVFKTGPDVVTAGDVFTYIVNVSGINQQSIVAPGVNITDVLPSQVVVSQTTVTRGTLTQNGQTVQWNLPVTTTAGFYNETLFIRVRVPALGQGECGAGGTIVNWASASARGCNECAELTSNAGVTSRVQDFLGENNTFSRSVAPIELCAAGIAQTVVNHVVINDGITWTGTIFTDTLGLGILSQPLQIVSGTLQVLINGVDRTTDVAVTPGPPLSIDFSAKGSYSSTVEITITYQVTAAFGTIPVNSASQTEFLFASMHLGGYPDTGCGGGDVGYFGSYATLNQGILRFSVTPGDILACRVNNVILTVNGPSAATLTDHLKVIFTADPSDIFTPTQLILGGSFFGSTPLITRTGNMVTFTFPTNQDFDGSGTLSFPLFRPCGVESDLTADVQYQDRCQIVRTESGTGGTTTRISNVSLFVTPNQYTVNTRDALWRFYVGNGSTVAAENAIVTNTLPLGHKFISASITSNNASTNTVNIMTGTLPSGQEVVTFTITSLPAYARLRFDVFSMIDSICNLPADIQISLFDECGRVGAGQVCQGRQDGKVSLLPGPAFLVSSNNQTAKLPLCETGFVELVVKNASAAADVFDFQISDVLTNATLVTGTVFVTVTNDLNQVVTGTTSGQLLANLPFTPSVVANGLNQTLSWNLANFLTGTPAYDVLIQRKASEVITILFQVRTGCTGTEAKVASIGAAKDVCQRDLRFEEDAKTLLVNAPELRLTKQGYNVTRGYPLNDLVFARPGDVLRWQIDVSNIGDQYVLNLFVTDTLPINFTYTNSNLGGVFDGVDTVSWALSGTSITPVINIGQTITFIITGTVNTNNACMDTQNQVFALFACTTGDLCMGLPASADATIQANPSIATLSSQGNLTNCGGDITIRIVNDGPPADHVVFTDTLPSGFVYASTLSSSSMPDILPSDGDNPAVWKWTGANLLPSGTTTMVFRVRNSETTSACAMPTSPLTNLLNLEYDDACASGPYYASASDTGSISLNYPNLVANKTPQTQVRNVGDVASWTLSVQNTGSASAPNVVITDSVASNFGSMSASNGSYGTTPVIVGNEVYWTPGFTLPVGGSWSATISATVLSNGENTNILTATATCGSGCQYASTSKIAYVTLLSQFEKGPAFQSGTIGDLQIFTFTANLPDEDAIYRNLILSDTIPSGLGYVSSSVTYTVDGDGSHGGPFTYNITTPTSAPARDLPGTIRWELGDLIGTVQINGVMTAVVRDISSNTNRVILTNRIRLSYIDDGQPYTFIRSAQTQVVEPLLHINKSSITEQGCSAFKFVDNFNDGNANGWSPAGTISAFTYRPPTGSAQRILGGPMSLLDISYSAMVSSTDAIGDLGLIFRAQDSNNYYRFRWNRASNGTGQYFLERVTGGTNVTTLASGGTSGYTLNRWHHLEARAQGSTFQAFIDGVLVLTGTDVAPTWNSGQIGFYSNNQQYAFFDDVWVTNFGRSGCFVGFGELVTYTLVISNQWTVTAQDLRVIDVIPPGTSLQSFSYQSDDPTTTATSQPSPIPGVTGALTWDFNQLAPFTPYMANHHSAITLTMVISVSPAITASTILINQALLTYDTQAGDGPEGIQRNYSGGSHSNAIQTVSPSIFKESSPLDATIGQAIYYTLTVPAQPITATLYQVTVTDDVPSNLLVITGTLQIVGGVGAVNQSNGNNLSISFASLPAMTQARITFVAAVRNILPNQEGVVIPNQGVLNWDAQPPTSTNVVSTTLFEPTLAISKTVYPSDARPGDTVFYNWLLYHTPGDIDTAYNVAITDVVPANLNYIPGTLSMNNGPGGSLNDASAPMLRANFPVVDSTWTLTNPIRLSYAAVVKINSAPGSLITNTAWTTWTSLPDNPYGETRDGSGGVNDYNSDSQANLALPEIGIDKTGPLTVTAGELITYVVTIKNYGPYPVATIVTDTMPFQVDTLNASPSQGVCAITPASSGDLVVCNLGDLNPGTATIIIVGRVEPGTPLAADLTNRAVVSITSPDGDVANNTAEVDTEVFTRGDLELTKSGPATAIAGEVVTYTITVTNNGPSVSNNVDVKDLLPPGLTYLSANASQGLCVSGICQLGNLPVGGVATVTVAALVGSDVMGVVTNTAQVFANTLDNNPNDNRDTQATTISGLTRLEIAKVDLTDPVYAGETYIYEIVITNTGPSDAQNVVISDTLPGYVSFQGASPECNHDGSPTNGAVTCMLGTLPAGESRDYLINVRVNTDVISGTVGINRVRASTTTPIAPDSILFDEEPTTYLQKTGSPTDLELIKSATPSSVIAGSGRFTYTLTVVNNGPAPASAVQVIDAYPRQFNFISADTSDGLLCNQGVTCDLGEMQVGETVVITLVVDVPADAPAGVYTNTAHVGSASPDSNPDNNDDSATTTVITMADLQIQKVVEPDPATPGERLTYYLEVTNEGPSLAQNVTVSDTIPVGFQLDLSLPSQGACGMLGNLLTCSLGDLYPDEKATISLVGSVLPGATAAQIANTASVTSTTPGLGDVDTVTPSLQGEADLVLIKIGTANAIPGEVVSYTVFIQNLGPGDAQNVIMTDTLPSGLTYLSISPNGSCTPTGNRIVCSLGTLAPTSQQIYVITALVDGNVEPGASLENQAQVTTSSPDPNPLNNFDDADTSITGQADLQIEKLQLTPNPVNAGDLVTYTITLTNAGPGMARSVDVKDQLPAGFGLEGITASGGGVCGGAVCQFGTLQPGEVRTITVVARVDSASATGTYTNTAAAYSTDESNPADNTDSVSTAVETSADLSVRKVDLKDPVGPTEGFLYQISVYNAGLSDAQNVVVTDTLDANVRFENASPECFFSSGQVFCTLNNLAAGASSSFLIAVTAGDVPSGTILTNTVWVGSDTYDPNPANNQDRITTQVEQQYGPTADLGIQKTGLPTSVAAGELVTYSLVITNAGPQAGTNVRVLELVPAGTTVLTITVDNPDFVGEHCSLGGSCYLGTVYSTTMALIRVVLQVNPDFTGNTIYNTASVSADQRDPKPENNLDDETTQVTRSADLALSKADLVDPVIAGELILYQVWVTNTGPSVAYNVTITDAIPVSTTYVGASPVCSENAGIVACGIGNLAAGGSRSVLIQVRADIRLTDPSIVTNTARVQSETPDPNQANNQDQEPTTIIQSALNPTDLEISKSDDPDPVIAGELLTYTLIVTNHGPAPATNVMVVDALPDGVMFVAATTTQGTCNAGVTCALGDLAVNGIVSIRIVARVDSIQLTNLMNYAQVSAANPDLNTGNNVDSEVTQVETLADLALEKSGSEAAIPGDSLAYQIRVQNSGPSDARNVVISDTLPTELISPLASASQGSCAILGNLLTCNLGDLPADGTASVAIMATLDRDATATFTNTAEASSDTPENNLNNNRDDAETTPTPTADLSLVKRATATAAAGTNILYTLSVYNHGMSTAQAITVTDVLPAGVSFASASPACSPGAGVVTCFLASLDVNTSTTFTILVDVPADTLPGVSLENNASVAASTPDTNPVNNQDDADTSIIALADLGIDKATVPDPVIAGEIITYTVVVTNYGPSLAMGVVVWDFLPSGVTLVSIVPSQGDCMQTLCMIGDLPPGETISITIIGRVNPNMMSGSLLRNRAQVSSPTPDPGPHPNMDQVTNLTTQLVDVSILKSHVGNLVPGQPFTYSVLVENSGPSMANSLFVTDTLPLSLTYLSNTDNCTLVASSPDVLRCSIGDLVAAGTTGFQVKVLPDVGLPAGVVTNTVQVTTMTTETNKDNNLVKDPTQITPISDLRLGKTDYPDPVVAGENLTYTLLATNLGPSLAVSTIVTDTLPPQVSFLSADESCTLLSSSPDIIACSLGDLAPNVSRIFHIYVRVSQDALPGSSLINRATIGSQTPDSNPTNNGAVAITGVVASADLGVDKTCPGDSIVAGEIITYTVVITNAGPSTARDVDLKDFLPAGLSLISAQTWQGAPCLGSLCQLGDIQPNERITITIGARVNPDVLPGSVLDNRATIFSDTSDPDSDNNSDHCTNTTLAFANLRIDKRDLVDPVGQGGLLIYQVDVTNDGPSLALNVVVTDTLPIQVVYLNNTDHCVQGPVGMLTCALDALGPGATKSFLITVQVPVDIFSGTVLHNFVVVTTTTTLTGTSILTDVENTLVIEPPTPPADLEIQKTADPKVVVAGQDIVTFTLWITNNGPATATDVEVVDLLPDGLNLISVTTSQGFCWDAINCSIGVMHVGKTAMISIVAMVDKDVMTGTLITNTALVRASQPDPNPDNNMDEDTILVQTLADLSLLKSDNPDPVTPGESLHYKLVIANLGPSDAQNLVVTDTLPAEVVFVASDPPPVNATNPWIWNLGSLPAGMTTTIEIEVDVNPWVTQTFTNTALVASSDPDPNPNNNQDQEPTNVSPLADLSVVKAGNPHAVLAGDVLTYTLLVYNAGPSYAQNVQVTDYLPGEVSFITSDPIQNSGPNPLIWNLGAMAVGESQWITIVVSVNNWVTENFTNIVQVESTTLDPNLDNNTDSELTHVNDIADLSVIKQAYPQIANPEDILQYLITVHNAGPTPAQNVVVQDTLPLEVTFVSSTPSPDNGPDPWIWNLGTLLIDETRYITLSVFIEAWATGIFTNAVEVTSTTPDPNEENNFADTPVIVGTPDSVNVENFRFGVLEPLQIRLNWETLMEPQGIRFMIFRARVEDLEAAQLVGTLYSNSGGLGSNYSFDDTLPASGVWWYWLVSVDSRDQQLVYAPLKVTNILLALPVIRKD